MAVPVARRNLLQSRVRLAISVGGVALAALLVLALDGVFAGSAQQVTVFMQETPFDVVVSQRGVKNMHMTTSFFPDAKLDEIRRVEGVESADPILFTTTFLIAGDAANQRAFAYLIGYEPGELGGPWDWGGLDVMPGDDEIVIDERVARDLQVEIGDTIKAAGKDFKVVSFARGTTSIINSIAFVSFDGFEKAQQVGGVTSFALLRAAPGVTAEGLKDELRGQIENVTVQTRREFADNERRIVSDMSIDVMRMMNVIAFIIGLAVTSLTVYTATLAKVREYGVMKALGVKNSRLYGLVLEQAAMTLGLGFLLSVALALLLQGVLLWMEAVIPLVIEPASVLRVGLSAFVLGLISAALPIARIAGIRPAEVFRR